MNIAEWEKAGQYVEVAGHRVFVMDTGANEPRETIVILHGYPTSSYDYKDVLPRLSPEYRVIIHDHLGFGLSQKPDDYSYSLFEQAFIVTQQTVTQVN